MHTTTVTPSRSAGAWISSSSDVRTWNSSWIRAGVLDQKFLTEAQSMDISVGIQPSARMGLDLGKLGARTLGLHCVARLSQDTFNLNCPPDLNLNVVESAEQ